MPAGRIRKSGAGRGAFSRGDRQRRRVVRANLSPRRRWWCGPRRTGSRFWTRLACPQRCRTSKASTARWEAEGVASQSPSWREADALSGLMLDSWPRTDWRRDDDTSLGRMLDAQARLKNVKRIDEVLAELSAEGFYAPADNAPLLRAAALLSPARATELLVGDSRPERRGPSRRLRRSPAALCRGAGWRSQGDRRRLDRRHARRLDRCGGGAMRKTIAGLGRRRFKPGFVVDLVSAASRIAPDLALRATERVLASPKIYTPDDVLTPAALALAKLGESKSWPAAARLREAALDHLRRRIALPLEPPPDWTRDNPVRCQCAECLALGAFLVAPDQRQWRLKALQERRTPCRKHHQECALRPRSA